MWIAECGIKNPKFNFGMRIGECGIKTKERAIKGIEEAEEI
jgi:hypothetical protein